MSFISTKVIDQNYLIFDLFNLKFDCLNNILIRRIHFILFLIFIIFFYLIKAFIIFLIIITFVIIFFLLLIFIFLILKIFEINLA